MKGLFIGSYPNTIEPYRNVFFRELIWAMARIGVECTVISPVSYTYYQNKITSIEEYALEKVEDDISVEVYHPRMVSFSAKKILSWNTMHLTQHASENAVLRVCKKLNMAEFDFVYGHFFLGGGLIAAAVGRKYHIPAYIAYGECNFETEVSSKFGDLRKSDLEGVAGIICVSSANLDDMKKRSFADGIPLFLSLNAINPREFHLMDKVECRKKLQLPENDFIVGFVGYFIERKGPNRVLEACKDLPGVKLAFAGKGNMELDADNVIFKKSLDHEDVAVFLNAVDVFALPTRHEGCCNAVIEAMACGKAIVSSDLPFNYDVLKKENAILINPNSVQEIREAVTVLRDQKDLRELLSTEALATASELTIEKRAHKILDFISRVKKS